jgi:hypothetical protein
LDGCLDKNVGLTLLSRISTDVTVVSVHWNDKFVGNAQRSRILGNYLDQTQLADTLTRRLESSCAEGTEMGLPMKSEGAESAAL